MVGPTLPSSGFRARSAGRPLERQATARSRYGLPGVGTDSRPEQWPRSSCRAALPRALVARASEARLTRLEWTRRGERGRERRRRARFRLEAGSRVLHMLGAERAATAQAASSGRAAAGPAARGRPQRRQTPSVGFSADDGATPERRISFRACLTEAHTAYPRPVAVRGAGWTGSLPGVGWPSLLRTSMSGPIERSRKTGWRSWPRGLIL
jgi:hypothetical protein